MNLIENFATVSYMPIFEGKRLEFVGVKFNEAEKSQFEKIGEDQDRAMSYVVRELALRGLVLYLQDRNLKPTQSEIETARVMLDSNIKGDHSKVAITRSNAGSPRVNQNEKPDRKNKTGS